MARWSRAAEAGLLLVKSGYQKGDWQLTGKTEAGTLQGAFAV